MFFDEIESDLIAHLNFEEYTIEAVHHFGDSSEVLDVVFDETAKVPSFIIPMSKAAKIDHLSTFIINNEFYGVTQIELHKEQMIHVYLDEF
jgi:hypothetical protein